jgi:hypothetical protein
MPAFWLDAQLPADADFERRFGPIMTLVLIAIGLVAFANLVGCAVVCARVAVAMKRSRR